MPCALRYVPRPAWARHRGRVDASSSGLVLTGNGALAKAGQLREEGFDAALLVDEGCYRVAAASEEAPFPVLDNEPAPLFGDPLEHLMPAHLASVDLALTPTGYLHAGAVGALETAAARGTRLGDPRVVFTVPIDASWLHRGRWSMSPRYSTGFRDRRRSWWAADRMRAALPEGWHGCWNWSREDGQQPQRPCVTSPPLLRRRRPGLDRLVLSTSRG